jgi:hypothetical protein
MIAGIRSITPASDELVQNGLLVGPAARSISLHDHFVQLRLVAILVRLAIRAPNQDDNNGFIPSGRDPTVIINA